MKNPYKSSAMLCSLAAMLALPLTNAFAVNPISGKPEGGNPAPAKKPVKLTNVFSVSPETIYVSKTSDKVTVSVGVSGDADSDISCPATIKIVSKDTGAILKNDQFNVTTGATSGATMKRAYDILFPAAGKFQVNFSMPDSPLCQGGNRSANIKVQGDGGHIREAFYQNHDITIMRNTKGTCSLLRVSRVDGNDKEYRSVDLHNVEFKGDWNKAINPTEEVGMAYLKQISKALESKETIPEGIKLYWKVQGLSADCWGWKVF